MRNIIDRIERFIKKRNTDEHTYFVYGNFFFSEDGHTLPIWQRQRNSPHISSTLILRGAAEKLGPRRYNRRIKNKVHSQRAVVNAIARIGNYHAGASPHIV